jgi:hypothetical protein
MSKHILMNNTDVPTIPAITAPLLTRKRLRVVYCVKSGVVAVDRLADGFVDGLVDGS